MEKILNSFRALYTSGNVCETHWVAALLLLLPSCFVSTTQFFDKDSKELLLPLAVIALVFLIASILPLIALNGFNVKFMNKWLKEPMGLPSFDKDCIIKGFKLIPLHIVWGLYIGVPLLAVIAIMCTVFASCLAIKSVTANVIVTAIIMLGLFFLVAVALMIIAPFIRMIEIKFSENFQYTAELFNPLTPFYYMKKAFKETVIVVFKYFLVSIVVSTVTGIITFFGTLFVLALIFIAGLAPKGNIEEIPLSVTMFAIILLGIISVIRFYAYWVVNLALVGNLADVYKNKIKEN